MYEIFFAVLFPKFRILDTKNRIRMDRKCAALPKQAYYQKNGPSAKSIWYEFRPMGVGVTVATPGAVDTGLYGLSPRLRRLFVRLGKFSSLFR